MDPHVPVQVAGLREPQQTQFALVGLFSAVNSHVFGQRGRVGEGFLAHATSVGSFARMGPHVSGH